ncbi:hypothetical protein [Rhizobium sp.]
MGTETPKGGASSKASSVLSNWLKNNLAFESFGFKICGAKNSTPTEIG